MVPVPDPVDEPMAIPRLLLIANEPEAVSVPPSMMMFEGVGMLGRAPRLLSLEMVREPAEISVDPE